MNDDIKETLNYLTKFINDKEEITKYGCEISVKQAKQLLDYITNLQQELKYQEEAEIEYNEKHTKLMKKYTNLQQENERLKELVNPKTQIFIDTQDMEERYGEELYKEYLEKQIEDYKLRCEKAIPMLKELNIKLKDILNTGIDIKEISDIEDTLNGRSDE